MKKIFLIAILVLASVLRLYKLSAYPAGLNADEAALGYNAYSLLLTGKDEHGHSWPVNLESFGDFKPAGYAYLLIPFIKIFGLTEFAVRFPSALLGILAVLFIYLLTKEITGNWLTGQLAALMLAISPWHLHFSRGAWEVNMATTLILLGVWFFLKKRYMLSVLWFVLAMYTYQSARLISPVLGLGLLLLYRPKKIIPSFLLLVVLLLPLGLSIIRSDAASRFSGVGLLADEGPLNRVKELRGQHTAWNSVFSRVLHNRPVNYALAFAKNYLDHFTPDFLFISGDMIERNRVPETGLLYLTDFIFLVLGAVYLLKAKDQNPRTKLVWLWLLISPLASALTFQTPHALRAQNMVIPLTILVSAGLYQVLVKYRSPIFYFLISSLYLWQFARYLHQYYVHYPQTYPAAWEYGFKELVSYTQSVVDRYPRIWVTDKYDQPYILFLFYSKYPPQDFQGQHKLSFRDKFNFSTVRDYGKFHFASSPWDKVRDMHNMLIVAAPEDIPSVGVNIVKVISFPNGQPAFKIISN